MNMTENREVKNIRAILAGVARSQDDDFTRRMNELSELVKALEIEPCETIVQYLEHPAAATYIGSGKVNEIVQSVRFYEADYVIFEDTLSPSQLNNLQKEIDAVIWDRTGLILEIFSKRAKTREARAQVESAKLSYMLPRLAGMRQSLSRQGGASGSLSNKGSGEKQIELDRRRILKRISELKSELDMIEHNRDIQRSKREKADIPLVALVGYTNAGKSTLLNAVLDASNTFEDDRRESKKTEAKDMLFATLDTTVRHIHTDDNRDFLLSDTVGFIDNLPHTLIKAFRSTLDEIKYADLLLEVVDASDKDYREHINVTENTLNEIGARGTAAIRVMNKCDRCGNVSFPRRESTADGETVYISAESEECVSYLISIIREILYKNNEIATFLIPYTDGAAAAAINDACSVKNQEYREDGICITADCPARLAGQYRKYIV